MTIGIHRAVPLTLGLATLAGVGVLLVWDAFPRAFPARTHEVLAASALAAIAVASLLYQGTRRRGGAEWVKAILLAAAFLFWGANQMWPGLRQATLFNDAAIALFVLDVFLAMAEWPAVGHGETGGHGQG